MGTENDLTARGVVGNSQDSHGVPPRVFSMPRGERHEPPLPTSARDWALFLDIDGTLLDLAPTPDAIYIPPMLPSLLLALHAHLNGALAFVSGRPIAALDRLFAPLHVPCAGLHGVERRDARGLLHRANQDEATLCELRRVAFELARTLPGILVEDKHFTVALHYAQAPQHRAALFSAANAIAGRIGFELQAGHKMYELKPPGIDKGGALTAFLDEPPFAGRRPLFFGDDLTDEYAHAVTRARGGMAVQVGARIASVAQYELDDPAAVLAWLQRWNESLP